MMYPRERIRMIRIMELARKHPTYLDTLGVRCRMQTPHKHI